MHHDYKDYKDFIYSICTINQFLRLTKPYMNILKAMRFSMRSKNAINCPVTLLSKIAICLISFGKYFHSLTAAGRNAVSPSVDLDLAGKSSSVDQR